MTLVEHLYELRNRLAMSLIAIAVTTVFGYVWFGVPMFGAPSLGEVLKAPYCAHPGLVTAPCSPPTRTPACCSAPARSTSSRCGSRSAPPRASSSRAPIWLYQIWAFITPGLYAKERKYALTFVSCAAVLFVAGAVLAYFVVAQGLSFLLQVGSTCRSPAFPATPTSRSSSPC